MLNIGQAAAASGVSAKMIRHYEGVGMLPAAKRTESGYRQYGEADVQSLRFIRHSRDLGFSLPEITELLSLWQNRKRSSRQVKALAQAHIEELNGKLEELKAMKATLEHLVDRCHGDDRPDCPIIETLEGERGPGPESRRKDRTTALTPVRRRSSGAAAWNPHRERSSMARRDP